MSFDILHDMPPGMKSDAIVNAMTTCQTKLRSGLYKTIVASISGGSDSDVMLDIIQRVGGGSDVKYIFFDTGIEYAATKEHLGFLESKYGITIQRIRAKVPVPLACKRYGVPFLSKVVSMFISRLQSHGFQWEDKPYAELVVKYPRCQSALKWWCNEKGNNSAFNISRNRGLKEFIMANPPWFRISEHCCDCAKKQTARTFMRQQPTPAMNCMGLRRSEGGIRATRYPNCFTPENDDGIANYRPIFFFTDDDKAQYDAAFGVTHSGCYSEYGLDRTGCAGCPFGVNFEKELEAARRYEPKLYKAVSNIFGESYEYTRQYREFQKQYKENSNGALQNQF